MVKPEWGSKRTCSNCGARFYDLRRHPILCPVCGTVFDPERQPRVRRAGPTRDETLAPKAAAKAIIVDESVDVHADLAVDDNEDVEDEDEEVIDDSDADIDDAEDVVVAKGKGGLADADDLSDEEDDVIEDTSDLGEDDDDIGEVMDHVDDDSDDKP